MSEEPQYIEVSQQGAIAQITFHSMPGRYADYPDMFTTLNRLSNIALLTSGLAIAALIVLFVLGLPGRRNSPR